MKKTRTLNGVRLKNGCCITAIFVPTLVVFFFLIFGPFPPPPDLEQMEVNFQENKEQIFIVRDYLVGLDYEIVSIDWFNFGGTMFAGLEHGRISIDNKVVTDAIYHLHQNGYYVIGKGGDGIRFLNWRTRNHGRGIVYSMHGNTPTESDGLTFLTRIEPLSEEGWYYFVVDFHVWRSRNR